MSETLSTTDAAAYLGKHPVTLRRWRARGTGPRYTLVGGWFAYHREDLDQWLESNRQDRATEMADRVSWCLEAHRRSGGQETTGLLAIEAACRNTGGKGPT